MSSRDRKKHRRRSKPKKTPSPKKQPSITPEPILIKKCNQLLNQITNMDDSKPFHKKIPTKDKIYREYNRINPKAISFKTIHERLHKKPTSHYKSYKEFYEDVMNIFVQEENLKKYKGPHKQRVEKRMQYAKRVKNHWNTLNAPYQEYGFQKMIDYENGKKDESDGDGVSDKERDEGQDKNRNIRKMSESEKKQQSILSNIKKRVKRGEETPIQSANKRRKLNDKSAERISTHKKPEQQQLEEDDDSKKQIEEDIPTPGRISGTLQRQKAQRNVLNDYDEDEDDMKFSQRRQDEPEDDDYDLVQDDNHNNHQMNDYDQDEFVDEYNVRDTPFTPFAEKSRVFNKVIGSADELFINLPSSDPRHGIKKRLHFGMDDNRNRKREEEEVDEMEHEQMMMRRRPMYSFEIKYRHSEEFRNQKEQRVDIEALQMDMAVRKFRETYPRCKILTVKLNSMF